MEISLLFGGDSAKSWTAVESQIESSPKHATNGATTLHWHVPIDYYTGEANYPVGWPRLLAPIKNSQQHDWSDWDFMELDIFTESSRTNLPHDPVTLHIQGADRNTSLLLSLKDLKIGEWTHVRVPAAQAPFAVRSIQFSLSESAYRHGDTLDLFMAPLVLTRPAAPAVTSLAAENTIAFADTRAVALTFDLLGLKRGETAEVECSLLRDGNVIETAKQKLGRGTQRMLVRLSKPLSAGTYQLRASAGSADASATTNLRIVSSPFQ